MIVTAQASADAAGRAGWAGMRLLLEEKEAFVFPQESRSAVQLEAGGRRVLFTRAGPFPGDALPQAAHTWLPLCFNSTCAERSSLATKSEAATPSASSPPSTCGSL